MKRSVSFLLLLLAAIPLLAGEPDRDCTMLEPRPYPARIDLRQIFATGSTIVETGMGVSATLPVLEVVIARIGPDGRPILACVDSEESARRFFEAPIDRLRPASPREK